MARLDMTISPQGCRAGEVNTRRVPLQAPRAFPSAVVTVLLPPAPLNLRKESMCAAGHRMKPFKTNQLLSSIQGNFPNPAVATPANMVGREFGKAGFPVDCAELGFHDRGSFEFCDHCAEMTQHVANGQ